MAYHTAGGICSWIAKRSSKCMLMVYSRQEVVAVCRKSGVNDVIDIHVHMFTLIRYLAGNSAVLDSLEVPTGIC